MKEVQDDVLKQQLINDSGYKAQFSVDVVRNTRLFYIAAGDYIVKEEASRPICFTLLAAEPSFTPHYRMAGFP